ncbi:hypothetical protein ACFFQW_42060 [Umezawaea endophytica]|uniref:Cupin domain-containing protein n=1 Tax=Umezawaea endophytica TaxID=1654476 RepID=A0A9X2VJV1_9PSEU|nr:hypothetical protein [Umezawaea endophytica]MCS7477978.1 hypothetical protein [Umezawaea endophytica]
MGTVIEELALIGSEEPLRVLERDERLLLSPPHPSGPPFTRTLDADEVQYQIGGRRTLVSQRGPGDLVRIPLGVAHTSVAAEPTEHLVLPADRPLLQVAGEAR